MRDAPDTDKTPAGRAQETRRAVTAPLSVEFSAERGDPRHDGTALAIGEGPQALAVTISNLGNERLAFAARPEGAGNESYTFRLSFRPGILRDPEKIGVRDDGQGWRVRAIRGTGGRDVVLVFCGGDVALGAEAESQIGFVLTGIEPDGAMGAGQAELAINFQGLTREDGSEITGHLLGRVTLYDPVTSTVGAGGGAGLGASVMGPVLGVVASPARVQVGRPSEDQHITLTVTNTSGRTLPMRKGDGGARISAPSLQDDPARSELYALNDEVQGGQVGGAWDMASPPTHCFFARHDFDWEPGNSYELELHVAVGEWDGKPRRLLLEYENFGESGREAGEIILTFDTSSDHVRHLSDKSGEVQHEVVLGDLLPASSPLSIYYRDQQIWAHADELVVGSQRGADEFERTFGRHPRLYSDDAAIKALDCFYTYYYDAGSGKWVGNISSYRPVSTSQGDLYIQSNQGHSLWLDSGQDFRLGSRRDVFMQSGRDVQITSKEKLEVSGGDFVHIQSDAGLKIETRNDDLEITSKRSIRMSPMGQLHLESGSGVKIETEQPVNVTGRYLTFASKMEDGAYVGQMPDTTNAAMIVDGHGVRIKEATIDRLHVGQNACSTPGWTLRNFKAQDGRLYGLHLDVGHDSNEGHGLFVTLTDDTGKPIRKYPLAFVEVK